MRNFYRELGPFNSVYLLLWICILFTPACKEIARDEVPPPTLMPSISTVGDASKDIGGVSKDLGSISENITRATDSIDKKDTRRELVPEVRRIRTEVPKIESNRQELTEISKSLTATAIELQQARDSIGRMQDQQEQAGMFIEKLEADIASRDEAIRELESEAGKLSKRLLVWTILAGVVCIAVCGMLVFNGKGGISLGVFGIFLIVGSTAASFIMAHAWIGGIAVLFTVGVVVYKIWELCRSKRGNKELVATAEKLKKHLPDSERRKEFGDLVGDGEVGMIQSEGTKTIVREERAKLRGLVTQIVPRESES